MFKRIVGRCLLLTGTLLFNIFPVLAQDSSEIDAAKMERFELDEVVVTGTMADEKIKNLPKNVSVITSYDIEQSPSRNIPELLSREANIQVRGISGSGKHGSIDIRGNGATSVSNVIIMLDGYRMNAPDLSGADLSAISLDQIERIEIIRGAGSVVYGNGAVGGVINIITKQGAEEPYLKLYQSYGSYNTRDSRLTYSGSTKKFKYHFNAGDYKTDSYRENGYLKKKNLGLGLNYNWSKKLSFSFKSTYGEDEYGFPGPVSKEDVDSRSRRDESNTKDDYGWTYDRVYLAGVKLELDEIGIIEAKRGYRFRDNYYIMGYSPLKSKADQTSFIDDDSRNLNFTWLKSFKIWGLEQKIKFGFDQYETAYITERLDQKERKNSEIKTTGGYLLAELFPDKKFKFTLGYRANHFDGDFRDDALKTSSGNNYWENGEEYSKSWSNQAYELGLNYFPSEWNSLFANVSTSFRIPNVDELAKAEDGLEPQNGQHIDLGWRHSAEDYELTVSLFQVRTENEIYYGGTSSSSEQLNRNYEDTTKRRGIETEAKFFATDTIYLWGNYSWMEAKFEKSGNTVPLVAEEKAGLGTDIQLAEPLSLTVSAIWVGERYDGNDLDNKKPKMDAYHQVDTKLNYKKGKFKLFGGINNLTDQLYSTSAYSETYYPAPTRNYYAGVEVKL